MLYSQKLFITLTKTGWFPTGCAMCLSPHKDKMAALPAPSLFPDNDKLVGASHKWLSPSVSPRQWKTMTDKPLKAKLFMLQCAATLSHWAQLLSAWFHHGFVPYSCFTHQYCQFCPLCSTGVQAVFAAGQNHIPELYLRNGKGMGDDGREWGQSCGRRWGQSYTPSCIEERDVTSQDYLLFIVHGQ